MKTTLVVLMLRASFVEEPTTMQYALRNIVFLLSIGSTCSSLFAQDQDDPKVIKQEAVSRKQFMFFSIPTVINGSRIDPSPIPAFSFETKDTKFEMKYGWSDPFTGRKSEDYRMTLTATGYIKAGNSKANLFSKQEWMTEYGTSLGLNLILGNRQWTGTGYGSSLMNLREARRKDTRPTWREAYEPRIWVAGDTVSERVIWLAGRLDLTRTKDQIFAKSTAGLDTLVARELGLGVGYVSFNFFFHSELKRYRWRSSIFSLGIGGGSFTNLAELGKRTLSEGTVVYNANNTAFTTVTKTSEGYLGVLSVYHGPSAYSELYWPRFSLDHHGGTLSLGSRVTWYDAEGLDPNWRLTSGLFFNSKKKESGKTSDKFSFAITANFDRFQDRAEEEYIKDHFVLQLSASVPLVFN